MDLIDRSAIPALHAAARRHRSRYIGCLLASLKAWLVRAPVRAVPCA
jgi:hypothetical protein